MKISSLKFLTDENISPRIVTFLRKKGIDVVDVKENGNSKQGKKVYFNSRY